MQVYLIMALIFFIGMIGMFYWFRFGIRLFIAKHAAGKLDFMYKLYIAVGCLLIGLSLFMAIKTKMFVDNASIISGKVIQLIERQRLIRESPSLSDKNAKASCFTPIFSYMNSKKVEMQIQSKTCAYPPVFSIGDKVNLLVDENDPNASIIEDEWFALWGGDAITGSLGCLFLLIGSLGITFRNQQKKKQNK